MVNDQQPTFFTKLKWNLPWMVRYPFDRTRAFLERTAFEKKHFIITVANHFEPGWSPGGVLDHASQMRRLKEYRRTAALSGELVRDSDGTKFRHTNFYPAEQYHPEILEVLSEMQGEGSGEVEVHLHHGVEKPDTAENLRDTLERFRDTIAGQHGCLSRAEGEDTPRYAFVHGNLALANSCGGRFCGVDNEMRILRETGCYADMTLPSAPDQSQVPVINKIYECGRNVEQAMPHASGKRVSTNGIRPSLPLIMSGPLVLNWQRRLYGLPVPRIDDGALSANQSLDQNRFTRWAGANVTVGGNSSWVFIKLYCHGFFDEDQSACIGDDVRRFFSEVVEYGHKTGTYEVHFATAREMFNIASAAIDGRAGGPGEYRDYRLKPNTAGAIR